MEDYVFPQYYIHNAAGTISIMLQVLSAEYSWSTENVFIDDEDHGYSPWRTFL